MGNGIVTKGPPPYSYRITTIFCGRTGRGVGGFLQTTFLVKYTKTDYSSRGEGEKRKVLVIADRIHSFDVFETKV